MKGLERVTSFILLGLLPAMLFAQSSGTITQTVNQRNTIGVLAGTPTSGVTVGSTVNFNYQLYTAGAPAPTSDTVQFYDGSTPLGSPVAISQIAASNLLPYSQVNLGDGWTTTGTAPTVTPLAANGPDGSTGTATTISFPNTTAGSSGVSFAVPGTNYASQAITLSFYAMASSTVTISSTLTDSPQVTANSSSPCTVSGTWQRCTLSYTFPSNAGTGFAVSIVSSGAPAQTVEVWGVQVEEAPQANPYVSTIGTPRPTGAQAGVATFSWSGFLDGPHPITVKFPGDVNYVASVSNAVNLNVGKGAAAIAVVDNPVGTSIYGTAVTLTATVTGPTATPIGTVEFFDGATSLGSVTLDGSATASLTLVGQTSLPVGSHSIIGVFSGDANFNTVTSSAITHVVTKVNASGVVTTLLSSSLNPAVYGDVVTFSVRVTSAVGVQPTGTVSVMDGATSLGTVTLDATGNGTLTVPVFTAGAHTVVATYSGDSNYN